MANTIPSTYMSLPIPVPGQDPGIQFAFDLNSCLTILDQHNHTPGSGVAITPAAININTDLSLSGQSLTTIKSLVLSPQASLATLSSIYSIASDLYFNDGTGNIIRITQGGSVSGSAGTITGLPSGSASASFGSSTFVFQSATNTAANIDGGTFILRNSTPSSFGLTLSPPSAMGADYSLILPAIPPSLSFVTLDTSGNLAGSIPVSQGIALANLAASLIQYLVPTGTILAYGGPAAPAGFLYCNGDSVSRTTYANLFTAIGTSFGTASGSTFNIPDFRGRFLRGVDGGAGRDPDSASRTAMNSGGSVGDSPGSIESDAFANHTHNILANTDATSGVGGGRLVGQSNQGGTNNSVSTGNAGTSTETRPINAYVTYIIKI